MASERTMVVRTREGPVRVRCYPTAVAGLVVHPALGLEDEPRPLWVLAHEPGECALTMSVLFLCRAEAERVAALLAPLTDWTRELDPAPDIDAVRDAFERGTAWRRGETEAYRTLVRALGDDMIRDHLPQRCDRSSWHRVAFGWGETYVRLGTRLREPEGATILRFSADASEETARTVWNYERERFTCLDCDEEV